MKILAPNNVIEVLTKLESAGYLAYIVGGCVRDSLIGRKPKDWDIATSAKPQEIQALFPESVYENSFGTVGIKLDREDGTTEIIEATTFRKEANYSDSRHPDQVTFTDKIEEDLGRRDFTVNAMAACRADNKDWEIIDPYEGIEDLNKKSIRAVGDPKKRFGEDALRLMRAVRFSAELGFEIEGNTMAAIAELSDTISKIANERIKDELSKILMSDDHAAWGIEILQKLGLLKWIIPELCEGVGVGQNKHHIYTVWEHNMRALDYAARNGASLEVRIAALLHDVGKPRVKMGDGPNSTFHNHEVVGGKMTKKILERLCFPKKIVDRASHLVRHHLFYYNVGEVTEAGVRRFIRRVGEDSIDDLMKIREADRIGSGVPKAVPYKNRHLRFMIDKVRRDPVAAKMLVLRGEDLMEHLNIAPGPKVGMILNILLEEVLDNPSLNDKEKLKDRASQIASLNEKDLRELSEKAKGKKEEFEEGIAKEIKKKYSV